MPVAIVFPARCAAMTAAASAFVKRPLKNPVRNRIGSSPNLLGERVPGVEDSRIQVFVFQEFHHNFQHSLDIPDFLS